MAWQSSTINPATTSPAADITKITNDLQVLRSILGGGTDGDVPVAFGNLAYTGTLTGGTGVINIGSGQIYKDASGNVGIGTTAAPGARLDVSVGINTVVQQWQGAGTGFQLRTRAGDGSVASSSAYRLFLDYLNGTSTNGYIDFFRGAAGNDGFLAFGTAATERMRIDASGNPFFPSVSTTASAANAFLNSGSSPANQLLRSTSSIRYKCDIEDIEPARVDNAITGLRPIWYRSKAEADNKAWSWYGLLAEEVAAVEPRLVHWGYADDAYEEVKVPYQDTVERPTGMVGVDGRPIMATETVTKHRTERRLKDDAKLVPDGVQYERLAVLLLAEVKALRARVAALESA